MEQHALAYVTQHIERYQLLENQFRVLGVQSQNISKYGRKVDFEISHNPSKKVWKLFYLMFLIYLIPICKIYEVNHLTCFFFSKMTPSRSQWDDSGLNNSFQQADESQSKSDKVAIILDTIEHSSLQSLTHSPIHSLTSQH